MPIDDEELPDRPVPARRRAEERWRTTEPWRVRARRGRRLRIAVVLAVLIALGTFLAVRNSPTGLPLRADVGVASASGGGFEVLFSGCNGERLEQLGVYAGDLLQVSNTSAAALWAVDANGNGPTGHVTVTLGRTPAGFRVLVPWAGLPASPPGGVFTLAVQTSIESLRIVFERDLVAGSMVVTELGRYPLAEYERDEASCG